MPERQTESVVKHSEPIAPNTEEGAMPRQDQPRPYLPPLGKAQVVAAPASTAEAPSLRELREARSGPRKLSAVSLPPLRQSEILMPLEPSLDREALRPASFANIKGLQRRPLAMPKHHLQPARMITRATLAAVPVKPAAAKPASVSPAGAAVPAPPTAVPAGSIRPKPQLEAEPPSPFLNTTPAAVRPAAATAEPTVPKPMTPQAPKPFQPSLSDSRISRPNGEPLWHQLFSPDKAVEGKSGIQANDAPHYAQQIHESGYDWGDAGKFSVDGLPESKSNITPLDDEREKRIWVWQAIEGIFLSRAFSGALAVLMLVLFVGTIDVPWNEWARKQASNVRSPISAALSQLSRPIEERAAFFISDDFSRGLDNWSAGSIQVDPAGWLKVGEGLAIHEGTTELQDYRLDFDAKIQANAVGWSVRTRDENTFYGFKLLQPTSDGSSSYSLQRFSVIDGVKSSVSQRIDVPAHLARSDDFNRISVRVVKDQITTLVNGWGVDFWRDERIERGGVGLLADAGESALVRKMTVSGNDDTWGPDPLRHAGNHAFG